MWCFQASANITRVRYERNKPNRSCYSMVQNFFRTIRRIFLFILLVVCETRLLCWKSWMEWKYHFIFINEGFYIVISAKYWCYILTNILTTNHISFLFPTKYNVTIIPSPCEVNCILKVEKLLCAAVHNIHIYSDNLLMLHLLRECRAAHRLTLLEKKRTLGIRNTLYTKQRFGVTGRGCSSQKKAKNRK